MFTKGKWEVQELQKGKNGYPNWDTYCIRSSKTNVHIATVGDVDRYYEKQNRANARLIAAAPDLLEACKATALEWTERGKFKYDGGAPASMFMVNAAITAAEGIKP